MIHYRRRSLCPSRFQGEPEKEKDLLQQEMLHQVLNVTSFPGLFSPTPPVLISVSMFLFFNPIFSLLSGYFFADSTFPWRDCIRGFKWLIIISTYFTILQTVCIVVFIASPSLYFTHPLSVSRRTYVWPWTRGGACTSSASSGTSTTN